MELVSKISGPSLDTFTLVKIYRDLLLLLILFFFNLCPFFTEHGMLVKVSHCLGR